MKKIFILGLAIRLLLMVLAYHGDLSFIWDGPIQFMQRTDVPDQLYPPLAFLTVLGLSPLYWLSKSLGWWVLKIPYLLADIVILKGIWSLLPKSGRQQALVLWWLNPVVLYATYALGQIEIVMAAFLVISIRWLRKSKELAIFAISIAAAYKTIPVFFLPAAAAYLGDTWRQRAKLAVIGLSLPLALGVVFSQVRGFDVLESYFPPVAKPKLECSWRPDAVWGCLETVIGLSGYTALFIAVVLKKRKIDSAVYAGVLFSAVGFFLIGSRVTVIHRYVLLMPFLVILALKNRWSMKLVWSWMAMLFLAFVYTWPLQWGLVVRWYSAARERPALREWLAPWLNYEHVALGFRMITDVLLVRFVIKNK